MHTQYHRTSHSGSKLLIVLFSLFALCGVSLFLLDTLPSRVTFSKAQWQPITIEEQDTFDQIGAYFGVSPATLQEILEIPAAAAVLGRLQPGAGMNLQFNRENELVGLRYAVSPQETFILSREQAGWQAQLALAPFYKRWFITVAGAPKLLTFHQTLIASAAHSLHIELGLLHLSLEKMWNFELPIPQSTLSVAVDAQEPANGTTTLVESASIAPPVQAVSPPSPKLLFVSSDQQNINSQVYLQLRNIFKGVVYLDPQLRQSQRFSAICDQTGRVLLATLTLRNKTLEAIRYTNSRGHTGYYTPSGQSLFKSAFLTAPLQYKRISNVFTLHRWHPILHIMRAHYGIDYAAPKGTPIHAIGSGRVSFAGWSSGYGNAVTIHHNSRYQTLYAHMSHISYLVKPGQWVAQGQIIGYVGSTGLSTGPHLHFGLYEYGRPVNPGRILPKFKSPAAIAQRDMPDFLFKTNQLLMQLSFAQSQNIARG